MIGCQMPKYLLANTAIPLNICLTIFSSRGNAVNSPPSFRVSSPLNKLFAAIEEGRKKLALGIILIGVVRLFFILPSQGETMEDIKFDDQQLENDSGEEERIYHTTKPPSSSHDPKNSQTSA